MERQPYSEFLGVELLTVDENQATGRIAFREELTDVFGHLSGGAYHGLADAVGGACARATGANYTMQCCDVQYYASTTEEDKYLYAKATLRHRGSRTCIIAVELYHEDGVIAGDAQCSYSKF